MISIVIPVYGVDIETIEMTNRCLDSVRENTTIEYEFIVEFSSKDNRRSYAEAVNDGFKRATGDYIVILNNDTIVCANWIESMLNCFKRNKCGIGTLTDTSSNNIKAEIKEGYYGPCWMVSRICLDTVGLLDEQFFNSFSDSDYWVRVYLEGYKVYRNFCCAIEHIGRATCNKVSNEQDENNNRLKFINKYGNLDLEIYRRLRG